MENKQSSGTLFERSLKVAPGGVHSPVRAFKSVGGTPIFFARSEGAYLESVEGTRYIDFCQSFGPMILGHRDPDVKAAVADMLDTAWSMGACEPYSLELAEYLTSRVPFLEAVRFVSSGTEAVMSALRVARGATGRTKILKFDGCYHGHVDSMLVKAGSGLAGAVASDSAGVSDAQETLVAPLNDLAAMEKIFAERGKEIAAVILEPLPANFGLLVQTPEFIRALVEGARRHGILVIFDEVISGFRVHPQGMAGKLGIEPDLVTYGKVVGGGFPLGAFGGRKKYMDLVAPSGPVYQAGTLSANPISTRAGLATLRKAEKLGVIEILEKRTAKFAADLSARFAKAGADWTVSHMGSIFWIHPKVSAPIRSTRDFPANLRGDFPKFFHAAVKEGVYLAPSAFEVGFVSWAHSEEILAKALDALERAADVLKG
ncbi:MAG: glutamate-1-semialdehyde 2,1-aminomutase [Bdellovibrionales bacterium]|nr:glutamate-1-semialdehyde 2,1-aminomutase [Bdellovibrionales bacterium]